MYNMGSYNVLHPLWQNDIAMSLYRAHTADKERKTVVLEREIEQHVQAPVKAVMDAL